MASPIGTAQVSYVARFEMEKPLFLLGEPVFCTFTIRNTGARTIAFPYRSPSRVLSRGLEQEPRFQVADARGRQPPDPAPKPCGGAAGSAVYGSVTLPPGQTHTERWLLNQWARFSSPGRYQARAERRLPLMALDPRTRKFSEKPVAYALAIDELMFEIEPATQSQLQSAFQPYRAALKDPKNPDPTEAVLVVTSLPQPFLLPDLEAMAGTLTPGRWDRKQALEGLARLGTPAAWQVILKIAAGGVPSGEATTAGKDEPLRAYAILLLAEKGDSSFLPVLLQMVPTAAEGLRGDILRALGFFQDAQANQLLFERLHSANPSDRMNAILGLKNLGTKDSVPALLAMLDDREPEVRQVANFALRGLTGQRISLSPAASREELARVRDKWHAWWRASGTGFAPLRQPPCRDW